MTRKHYITDGVKSLPITDDRLWEFVNTDTSKDDINHLYSTVSVMYRCVDERKKAVMSIPFDILQGETVVYSFNGETSQDTPPRELPWLPKLPGMLGLAELGTVLTGTSYFEIRHSMSGRGVLFYDWMLPWSVMPEFDSKTGELLYFWRQANVGRIKMQPEDVMQFWPLDHAVEVGPAVNFPGRAVMQNAGVIGSLDTFLHGYFDRGMIAAMLVSYNGTPPSEPESNSLKEYLRRKFMGLSNANDVHLIRGDMQFNQIGGGIKDLRDNVLNKDEQNAIAIGMGVPPSKLLPVGVNRATKDGDDRGWYEGTILPEINWLYQDVNERMLNPFGYQIIAKPQLLRVMQADEVERATAFRAYVGTADSPGYTVKETESILGISVPQSIRDEMAREAAAVSSAIGGNEGAAVEKLLLNGVQITAALQIVEKFAEGLVKRENAINMYDAFLGINPAIAAKLIPDAPPELPSQPVKPATLPPPEDDEPFTRSFDLAAYIDKTEEAATFKRWLAKREQPDIDDFQTTILSTSEKQELFDEWATAAQIDSLLTKAAEVLDVQDV